VANKNLKNAESNQDPTKEIPKDQKNINAERILKNEDTNTEATSDEVKVNGKNIADTTDKDLKNNDVSADLLLDVLNPPAQQTSEAQSELSETEVILSSKNRQTILDFDVAVEEQNNVLRNYYAKELKDNPTEFNARMRAQKILSLEDMILSRKNGNYKSDEAYIESLKCV